MKGIKCHLNCIMDKPISKNRQLSGFCTLISNCGFKQNIQIMKLILKTGREEIWKHRIFHLCGRQWTNGFINDRNSKAMTNLVNLGTSSGWSKGLHPEKDTFAILFLLPILQSNGFQSVVPFKNYKVKAIFTLTIFFILILLEVGKLSSRG